MASAALAPEPPLPPRLRALREFLTDKGDVDILDIYRAVIDGSETPPLRTAQQYLGPYITKLNRRLRKQHQVVRPGRIKGTYTLTSL